MRPAAVLALTVGALTCFAANSLLARAALGTGRIDPASYTAVRLASGALVLWAIAASRGGARPKGGWSGATALFVYAAAFSVAYVRVRAGPGALLLFAAVQATMIGWGLARGARPTALQWAGLLVAIAGLAWLTLPGSSSPDPAGSALMAVAGIAWGAYTLAGRASRDPVGDTAGNFLRSAVITAGFLLLSAGSARAVPAGVALAAASGAVASGVGYSLWYSVVPKLGATRAAVVQLSVPVLAALGAIPLLGEPMTGRLMVAGAAIVSGVALAMFGHTASTAR